MNKNEIKELVDLFQLTSDTAKSCVNRFEASLSKTGSASSRLSMVGSSILKLAEQSPEDDQPTLEAIGNLAKFFSSVAVDNKKPQAEATSKKSRKTGWENLKPADAKPSKPSKTEANKLDEAHAQIADLLDVLNGLAELNARR
jgi:thiamine biosynthesis lipoprotein ApbE